MKLGINGSDKLAQPDLAVIGDDIAAFAEAGFSSYWLAQTGLLDATAALALAGQKTPGITLGTAVVPTWTRHPQALASTALTANAALDGRLVLGIGLAHQPWVEGVVDMKWERPIRHMLDYLDVLQPLLESGATNHGGDIWSYHGESARPTQQAPQVMLAALGEQMLKIAGRRTDGTILWCVGPRTIEQQIRPIIGQAASDAGRPDPSIVCSLPVWVTDNPQESREFIAKMLSIYAELPSYRAMLDIEGVHGLGELSLVGSRDEVQAGLGAIRDSGATDFTAVVMGANPDERAATIEAVANFT